jgi:hypothetical protein
MASNEPQGPRTNPSDAPDPESESGVGDDALSRLEARLDRASEAAERLIEQAAQRALGKPPPAGWQQRAANGDAEAGRGKSPLAGEAELLLGVLGALRDRLPPELQQRLTDAVREVLLALRALIDWYLERSERRRSAPVQVRDIPIL